MYWLTKRTSPFFITQSRPSRLISNSPSVIKLNSVIGAKDKAYKYSQATKSYAVSLKDNQGKVMFGKALTLTVNGKTFTAKTNSNGVATFKITNLNKVGTFNAVVSYAGDSTHNKVSAKVKITTIK